MDAAELHQDIEQRRETIARLQDELAQLEGLQRQQTGCPFFDKAPREIRDMIYGYCVAPGKIFPRVRPDHDNRVADRQDYQKPEWQLLAVSKQVREEAGKILMQSDQLVLNRDMMDMRLLFDSDPDDSMMSHPLSTSLSDLTIQHLTSLSMAFDMRGLGHSGSLSSAARMRWPARLRSRVPRQTFDSLSRPQRLELAHKFSLGDGFDCWNMRQIDTCCQLRFLQLDVTNCYCQMGCCRLLAVNQVAAIVSGWEPPRLEVIEVLGTKNAAERKVVVEKLFTEDASATLDVKLRFKKFQGIGTGRDLYNALNEWELDAALGDEEVNLREAHKKWQQDQLDKLALE